MADNTPFSRLAGELQQHLGFRHIEAGTRRLAAAVPQILALTPDQPGAGVMTGLLAAWVDAGFGCPDLVRQAADKFPPACRRDLQLLDYAHLCLALGFLAMSREDLEEAERHFLFIHSLEGDLSDPQVVAVANFWMARCLRKSGRYDDALGFIARGKALALGCGYTPMAAIMQVLEAWVAFQRGRLSEAAAILREAEAALVETDDYITRGNIYSAHGRIARRKGRHDEALRCFERAIAEFRRLGHEDIHLARSLSNMAFVERLIAMQLQERLDSDAELRKSGTPAREERARIERMREVALEQLEEAGAIYRRAGSHRGLAAVQINCGFLRLDAGDVEGAAAEAGAAFENGVAKRDYIAMARARILQCMIENTRIEEQIGDTARDAALAEAYAREAVEFAEHTQNRRLLARACVWQGITYSSSPLRREDAARRALERAIALLKPDTQEMEYNWPELEELNARLRPAGPADPLLSEWSSGLVGDRSFQQISEQFAAIVIPKVWEREGHKISRVATKLSISPKKVRRILQHAGLLGRPAKGAGA